MVKVEETNPQEVAEVLKEGKIIIYPTETVYGLGGDATKEEVVKRIFKIKKRGRKPISVAFSSLKMVEEYVEVDEVARKIAEEFLPGPLTLILPKKFEFPSQLTCGLPKVGVRIPDHDFILEVIEKFGKPITSTSANISGEKNPMTVEEAIVQIGREVDLILDGGKCKYGIPSTIVEIEEGKVRILREGPIKREEIEKVVG